MAAPAPIIRRAIPARPAPSTPEPPVRPAPPVPPTRRPTEPPDEPPDDEEEDGGVDELDESELIEYHDCYKAACPFCHRRFFWTDDSGMYTEAQAKAPRVRAALARQLSAEEVERHQLVPDLRPGIHVGQQEPVFPVSCDCQRRFIVSFRDYVDVNTERERRWWRDAGRYRATVKGEALPTPPRSIFKQPEWVEESETQYVDRVAKIRNPIVRKAIVGAFERAGFTELFPSGFLERVAKEQAEENERAEAARGTSAPPASRGTPPRPVPPGTPASPARGRAGFPPAP